MICDKFIVYINFGLFLKDVCWFSFFLVFVLKVMLVFLFLLLGMGFIVVFIVGDDLLF